MKILDQLLSRLRRGIATPDEIENLDRRLFCLGAAASAGGLIARPTIVDLGVAAPKQIPWMTPEFIRSALFGPALYYAYTRGTKLGEQGKMCWKVDGA